MKKTSGILLTLLLSSQFAFAADYKYKIDGNRIDITYPTGFIQSYKLSSIDRLQANSEKTNFKMHIDSQEKSPYLYSVHGIDKDTYEKIMDYMEDSK